MQFKQQRLSEAFKKQEKFQANSFEVTTNVKQPNLPVKNAICALSFEESSAMMLLWKERQVTSQLHSWTNKGQQDTQP